jgi:hypothetical protein
MHADQGLREMALGAAGEHRYGVQWFPDETPDHVGEEKQGAGAASEFTRGAGPGRDPPQPTTVRGISDLLCFCDLELLENALHYGLSLAEPSGR